MLKTFFKNNLAVLLAYLLLLALVGYVLLRVYKSDLHLMVNAMVGNPVADVFFKYITYVGDGLFVVILALLIMVFANARNGLFILFSYTTASLFTTVLKRCFYDDVNRPFFVFTYFRHQQLKLVEAGSDMLIHNSFPSGHATAAFALFFSLIFTTSRPFLKWLYLLLAILVAFSRTYLSQHWVVDIYVGSVIGACFSLALYILLYHRPFMEKLNRPLLRLTAK